MRVLLILIGMVFCEHGFSQKMLDYSSLNHCTAGIAIGSASSSFIGSTNGQRIIVGAFSGTIAGILKEVKDNMESPRYGNFGDLLCTTFGGVLGAVIVNNAIKRNEKRKNKVLNYKI